MRKFVTLNPRRLIQKRI